MTGLDLEERARAVFASAPGTRLRDFEVMEDGHAGLTFGFAVASASDERRYVLKIAPPGVRRSGNTDVHRQAPLLRALREAGLPVPDVPFADPEETALGSPYIVMDRLPGRTFVIWTPHPEFTPDQTTAVWTQTAQALAAIHKFDWRTRLPDWNHHAALEDQTGFWSRILAKSDDEGWKARGAQLAAALEATRPAPGPIGLVHGDYQPGNVLFENGVLTGVIDWELAFIGPQTLDVGWLLMMGDPACWHPDFQPRLGLDRDALLSVYEAARGAPVAHADWFQALACYRMAAISGLNVKLHRSGRRPDPIWDDMAKCVPLQMDRAFALLSAPNLGAPR